MTTSNSTTYNPVLYEVVHRSLRMVGAFASGKTPRPEQQADAVSVLNMMLKAWQTDGFRWLKSVFELPLIAGTFYYPLGPAGAATYWPDNTETINRPTRVWNLRRKSVSGYEVPLAENGDPMARSDYMMLPNKTTMGTPVQAYYDPQLVNGVLYVWPCPVNSNDSIIGDCDRTLQDMLSDDNTFDFPQEWLDPLTFCLAERLWWEYPDNAANYQMLLARASAGKQQILDYDRENSSIVIGMSQR